MTHPTDADVEAMWQAIRETFPASVTAPGRPDVEREFYRVAGARCARAALSALPHYLRAVEEREGLIEALENLVADVLEYERINNLAPNPGRRDCWQSVTTARAALAKALEP